MNIHLNLYTSQIQSIFLRIGKQHFHGSGTMLLSEKRGSYINNFCPNKQFGYIHHGYHRLLY